MVFRAELRLAEDTLRASDRTANLNFENDDGTSRRRVLGRPRVGLDTARESKSDLWVSHLNRWTVLGQCTL